MMRPSSNFGVDTRTLESVQILHTRHDADFDGCKKNDAEGNGASASPNSPPGIPTGRVTFFYPPAPVARYAAFGSLNATP